MRPLGWPQVLAYAGVNLPVAMLHQPTLSVLPALYAKFAHIDLVVIGAVLALTRALDAALDPLIGYFSDRTCSPSGRRKPWIVAGAVVCALATYFLFRPGVETGPIYFAFFYFTLYLGWSLVEIPHTAWVADLTANHGERARLFAFRNWMGGVAALVFMSIPLLPIWPSSRMTPATMAVTSWVIIALIGPLTVALVAVVPKERTQAVTRSTPFEVMGDLLRYPAFRLYLLLVGAPGLASGMVGGLYFFYLDSYLRIGAGFVFIGLIVAIAGMTAAPLAPWIIRRIGDRMTIAFCSASSIAILLIMLVNRPGSMALPIMFAAFGLGAFFTAGLTTALLTLLARVVDNGVPIVGSGHAGSYFAVQAFLGKAALALGGGLGLILTGLFGFHPYGLNSPVAMAGFFAAFIAIPIMLHVTAVVAALAMKV